MAARARFCKRKTTINRSTKAHEETGYNIRVSSCPSWILIQRGQSTMTVANQLPIFDGHNDTLLSLYLRERGEGRTFFERSEKGHLDLPRAREGGFGGGFFAVYIPPDPSQPQSPDSG